MLETRKWNPKNTFTPLK